MIDQHLADPRTHGSLRQDGHVTPPPLDPSVVGLIARGRFGERALAPGDAAGLSWHGLAAESAEQTEAANSDSPEAQALARAARLDRMRSMAVLSTAGRASAILRDAGLRALCYKGPALALQTSGVWLLRGSADADILIAESDVAAAHEALIRQGLSRRSGETGPPRKFLVYRDCECGYSGLPCSVDLHWRIEDSPAYFRLPFSELWTSREEVKAGEYRLRTLGQIDALLVTAVHGSRERWWKWRWALDAYRQVNALSLRDWDEAVERARRAGALRALAMALSVAQTCGLDRPDLPMANGKMMQTARAWLTTSAVPGERSPSAALGRRLARWRLADSPLASIDGAARATIRQLIPESRTFTEIV